MPCVVRDVSGHEIKHGLVRDLVQSCICICKQWVQARTVYI